MPQPPSNAATAIPGPLMLLGSVVIVAHLTVVIAGALAAPSGPWPTADGMEPPPPFANSVRTKAEPYLKAVKFTHTYRFPSNRMMRPGLYLEFRLKDEAGQTLATVKVPDDSANPWVRHRQSLLARWLGDDMPVMPPPTEGIPAPSKQDLVQFWVMDKDGQLKLQTSDVKEVPRERPVLGPNEVSLLLARSYARHLCRVHGAARAEVIRYHQDPIPPGVLFQDNLPEGAYPEQTSNFGELPP